MTKRKKGDLMINQVLNAAKRKAHYFWRLNIVTKSCEAHIEEIAYKKDLDLSHPMIQRIMDQCELLPIDKRGSFLAYILVLIEKDHSINNARLKAYDWAASS